MNIQKVQRVNRIIRLHMELNKEFHNATYHKIHLKEKQQKERAERAKAFAQELEQALNLYI